MLLALRLFALCAGALQLSVAAHVARRPAGPFRFGLAGLLMVNGLAALRLAVLGSAPPPLERWFLLLDGASGPLLLACGLLALRFPDHDLRDWKGWRILGVCAGWAAGLLVLGAIPPLYDLVVQPAFEWLHTVPALVGLSVAGLALARSLARARAGQAGEAGLVALGFLPTLGENVAWAFDHLRAALLGRGVPFTLEHAGRLGGQALVIAAGIVVVGLLLWPWGLNPRWRRALALTMVAGALGYLAFYGLGAVSDPARFFVVFLGTTVSFYVLRPIAVGLAYAPSRTLWSLYDVACLAVVLVLGKAAAVLLLGTPTDDMTMADLAGIGPALLVLPLLAWAARRRLQVRPQTLDRVSADELLGRFLLDHRRRAGPEASVGKPDIQAATGITENNVAAALRRLERRLDPAAAPGTFVAEQQVGVRGRKRYRLTETGAQALQARADSHGPAPARVGGDEAAGTGADA